VGRSPDHIIGRTTVRDALDSAVIALTAAGVDSPRLDAELLLAAATDLSRALIVTDPRRELDPAEARVFAELAARRRQREPVAYILGSKGFRGIELKVDPRVLIPRPETELLVEAALGLPHGARVVDVGTGSGAIVLEVTLLEGDLLAPVRGAVDAVLSNPPYVAEPDRERLAPEITGFEPAAALFAGEHGLGVYERLAPAARSAGATFVAVEVGQGQAGSVARILRHAGYAATAVDNDLAGIERVVRAW
jgi:release factor glutamine methyltransferase